MDLGKTLQLTALIRLSRGVAIDKAIKTEGVGEIEDRIVSQLDSRSVEIVSGVITLMRAFPIVQLVVEHILLLETMLNVIVQVEGLSAEDVRVRSHLSAVVDNDDIGTEVGVAGVLSHLTVHNSIDGSKRILEGEILEVKTSGLCIREERQHLLWFSLHLLEQNLVVVDGVAIQDAVLDDVVLASAIRSFDRDQGTLILDELDLTLDVRELPMENSQVIAS